MNDLLNQIKPWLAWLHLHPTWASAITFGVAFIECLAVAGLLVPGTVMLIAIGALIGSGVIKPMDAFLPAIVGAFLGDVVSFYIGHHYHEHLREIWPFKFYPNLLKKGENFFYQHGGKGVFVGRFLGPIRPVLPIIAGMLNMRPWRFLLADGISAIIWAPVTMAPGILLGAASMQLAPGMAMHLMLYVILALLVLWCISWLIKRFIAWVFNTVHNALDHLWELIKDTSWLKPLRIALRDPTNPTSHAQLTLGLYFIVFSGLFLWLAFQVYHQQSIYTWNQPFYFLLRSLRNSIADHILLMFTLMGEPKVFFCVFLIVLTWLIYRRAWWTVFHWCALGIFSFGGVELLKHTIHSIRPQGLLVTPSGYSFPSGHVTIASSIGGFMAVLIAKGLKKPQRWLPYTVLALFILCITASRLYLGAHWLTDTLGGILFATALVMFMTLSYQRRLTPTLLPSGLALVFFLGWFTVGSIYSVLHYQRELENYVLYIPSHTVSMKSWWASNGVEEPFYRLNRTGKPSEILNIQWAGYLSAIESDLMAKGWQPTTRSTLSVFLERVNKPSKNVELPLLPQLYLEQRPALVMEKPVNALHSLIVLSLWDSRTTFTDSGLPLWLGNVAYRHHWANPLLTQSPVQILASDLPNNYLWKQLNYPLPAFKQLSGLWWDGQLLLIEPNTKETY